MQLWRPGLAGAAADSSCSLLSLLPPAAGRFPSNTSICTLRSFYANAAMQEVRAFFLCCSSKRKCLHGGRGQQRARQERPARRACHPPLSFSLATARPQKLKGVRLVESATVEEAVARVKAGARPPRRAARGAAVPCCSPPGPPTQCIVCPTISSRVQASARRTSATRSFHPPQSACPRWTCLW